MSRLIETMRIAGGRLQNADLHLQRIERSCMAVFGSKPAWAPGDLLANVQGPSNGTHKCRLVYDHLEARFTIAPYTIRPVSSLKLVTDNNIVYDHKFEDRANIDALLRSKGDCDDILIVKNGMVTDVSYANIVFKKGDDWFTPESFLLNGTMRQYLIKSKKIKESAIRVDDIKQYTHFKLINAMLVFEGPELEVLNIRL